MKKIISILVSLILVFGYVSAIYADDSMSGYDEILTEAVARLSGLGILNGDETGLRLEDNITRAEFTVLACRLLNLYNVSVNSSNFVDVPRSHWACGYIECARSYGIIDGIGNNMFAPDNNITYDEAIKVIVSILGYDIKAENEGGWPEGYIITASNLGILKNTDLSGVQATRGMIAIIINNALDSKILEQDYGVEDKYYVSSKTLYDTLFSDKDVLEFSGIYNENKYSSLLNATPTVEDNTIIIGNKEFYSENMFEEYLGENVKVIAKKYKRNMFEITSMYVLDDMNNITIIEEDGGCFEDNYAVIYGDNNKDKRIKVSNDVVYLYNGRLTTNESSYINSDNTKYKLIDNSGDNVIDVIMITCCESNVIERIGKNNTSVYFSDNKLFRGRRGINLVSDDSEDDMYVFLEDGEGKSIELADVKEDCAITIEASEDMKLCKIMISFDTVEGVVSAIGDNNEVEISEKNYKTLIDLTLGESGVFSVDVNGKIAGKIRTSLKQKFGYITNSNLKTGMDSKLELQIISATAPQKEVKEKGGNETISYYLQNADAEIFTCREKIKFAVDDVTGAEKNIKATDISLALLNEHICKYSLDSDGKITNLTVYTVPDVISKCSFNADIFAFGGISATRGFATNEGTQVICVPTNVKTINDYGVRVYITDNGSYSVYGIKGISDYDIQSEEYAQEEVDVLILKSEMDSSQPLPVQFDADICIVGKVTTVVNNDGDEALKIEMLNGEERLVKFVNIGSAYDMAKTLRMGDLIRYSLNSDGTIANVKKLASVQGLKKYSSSGNYYGICEDVRYEVYDYTSNDYIDKITIGFNGASSSKSVKIMNSERQNIYLYNRRFGTIKCATTDDIVTLQQSVNPSKIFALMNDNDADAVVIIED